MALAATAHRLRDQGPIRRVRSHRTHDRTQDEHDLAHQHDVLPAYQKEANVLLRPEVGVIYLLPGVL